MHEWHTCCYVEWFISPARPPLILWNLSSGHLKNTGGSTHAHENLSSLWKLKAHFINNPTDPLSQRRWVPWSYTSLYEWESLLSSLPVLFSVTTHSLTACLFAFSSLLPCSVVSLCMICLYLPVFIVNLLFVFWSLSHLVTHVTPVIFNPCPDDRQTHLCKIQTHTDIHTYHSVRKGKRKVIECGTLPESIRPFITHMESNIQVNHRLALTETWV